MLISTVACPFARESVPRGPTSAQCPRRGETACWVSVDCKGSVSVTHASMLLPDMVQVLQ